MDGVKCVIVIHEMGEIFMRVAIASDHGGYRLKERLRMSIAANKMMGIRAALCGDEFSAHYTRAHNNANVLTLGARVIGEGLAENIVDIFLNSSFEGGRHARRIDKITEIERMKSCTNL